MGGGTGGGGVPSGRANGLFMSGVTAICEAFTLLPLLDFLDLGSARLLPPPPTPRAAIADAVWYGIACRGKERSSGRLSTKVITRSARLSEWLQLRSGRLGQQHVDLQSALTSSPPGTPPEMCRAVIISQMPQFPLCSDDQPLSLLAPLRVGMFNGLGNRGATALAERLQYTPRLRTLNIWC